MNTTGAANSGIASDDAELTFSAGTNWAGPQTLTVTSSAVALSTYLGFSASSVVRHLRIRNTGANAITLDMKNFAGNSCQIDISAGGQFELFGVVSANLANKALLSTWTLASTSGSTALITWVI